MELLKGVMCNVLCKLGGLRFVFKTSLVVTQGVYGKLHTYIYNAMSQPAE
jgi:hypothetical protein